MGHNSWQLVAVVVTLLAAAVSANAQDEREGTRIGKKGEIQLTQPTYFATVLLPAGHYEVQHATVNGANYLIVREQTQPTRRHSVLATGAEVARIPCRIVALDKPARFSFAYWTKAADGKPTVTQVHIADEAAGHLVTLEPSVDR
jgi:hypothetical protein